MFISAVNNKYHHINDCSIFDCKWISNIKVIRETIQVVVQISTTCKYAIKNTTCIEGYTTVAHTRLQLS